MNDYIHLLIATTCSMTMAFILYCIVGQTKVDNSLVQQFVIDVIQEYYLSIRCGMGGRHGKYWLS